MFGSCCEEQEAKEAEMRSKIRAATAVNERRLFAGHLQKVKLHRAVRCGRACCYGDCGECEEDESAAAVAIGVAFIASAALGFELF